MTPPAREPSTRPETASSTEATKAGWDLISVSCSDGNSSGSVPNRQATFNVEPGETGTCPFPKRKQSNSRTGMGRRQVLDTRTRLLVLTGQFIGLALVGRAVWKTLVPSKPTAPRQPASALNRGGANRVPLLAGPFVDDEIQRSLDECFTQIAVVVTSAPP